MINSLLLFTNNDVPFVGAKTVVHTPTIREISLIGEESFRIGLQTILNMPKMVKKSSGNSNSSEKDDFEIFIAIINNKEGEGSEIRNSLLDFLTLLFPNFDIHIRKMDIQFIGKGEDKIVTYIDSTNFKDFQEIISNMFPNIENVEEDYHPADSRAQAIVDKIKKAKEKKNKDKVDDLKGFSLYKRYISILAVGLPMDINTLLDYTVVQLENQFNRFILKLKFDATCAARLAGASETEDADDWMAEI